MKNLLIISLILILSIGFITADNQYSSCEVYGNCKTTTTGTITYTNATYNNITNTYINQTNNITNTYTESLWNQTTNAGAVTLHPLNLSQRVGIGTSNSAYDLEVRNTDGIDVDGDHSNNTYLGISSGGGNDNATLMFREATAVRYKIFYDGLTALFQIYSFAIDKTIMLFNIRGNVQITTNLTVDGDVYASNLCYTNGTQCNETFIGGGNSTFNQTFTDTLYTYYSDENYINKNTSNSFNFNDSKLSTIYYNATQSGAVAGTINRGSLGDTQHPDGKYDGRTFNFTEVSGSPGLDLRINFTGIDSFNQGIMRYKTSSLSGNYPIIQMWNYDTSAWEDYPSVGESLTFSTITQPVFDATDHVSGGIAQMRIYKAGNGNINNHYYVDWISVSKGFGTPSGEEIDPYSYHKNTNIDLGSYNITTTGYGQFAWVDKIAQSVSPSAPPNDTLRLYVESVNNFSFYKYVDSSGMVRRFVSDSMMIVFNKRGTSIPANRYVYATGSEYNTTTVDLAKANSMETMPSIGITIEAIPNGSYGRVMQVGVLENIDTNVLGFVEGDVMYVDDKTAGIPRKTPPLTPNLTQSMGTILVIDDVVGKIQVVTGTLKGNEFGTIQDTFKIGNDTNSNKSLIFDGGHTLLWNADLNQFDFNGNVTGVYGFWGWLGSIANRITKLWTSDIDVGTGNVTNVSYMTLNKIGGACDLLTNGTICSNGTGTYIIG